MDIIELKSFKDHSQNLLRKFLQMKFKWNLRVKGLDFINLGQIIKEDTRMSSLPHNINQVNLW